MVWSDGGRMLACTLGLWTACAPVLAQGQGQAQDQPSVSGDYSHSEMELVAGIRLQADGRFLYGLTVGALDETAQGRWRWVGNRIEFESDPRPVAPTITAGKVESAPGEPFALRLLTPDGRDMPGVDLRIDYDKGDPLVSYMAGGPFVVPGDDAHIARSVTFSMAPVRLQSPPLPLDPKDGTVAIFLLSPGDFGVVDMTGSYAEVAGDVLTLHRPEGEMQFRRVRGGSEMGE